MKSRKASSQMERIASITLILVILFTIYLILPNNILNAGKNFFNKIWGEEQIMDFKEADNRAQQAFDELTKSISLCAEDKSAKPCMCSADLNAFYSIYQLNLKPEGGIEMRNIKGGSDLFVKAEKTVNVNCYLDAQGFEQPVDQMLFESQGKPYLPLKKIAIFVDALANDGKLYLNPRIGNMVKISSTKVCWLIEDPASKSDAKSCAFA